MENLNMTMLSIHSANDVEILARMVFKADDVLKTEREKIRRHASLLKAAVLDSLSNFEVVLTLEDKESFKLLRSRIIATGDDRVMLDKGLTIPVQCIKQIDFPR
jgi:acyl carrier protein